MQSRFIRGLAMMELEERILNGGALIAFFSVFLPWVSGDWIGGDHVSYSGLGFYTEFLGICVLLLYLAILLLAIIPLCGGPILIKKKKHREIFRLAASAQAVILTLASLSVLMKVSFEFSRMEVRYGLYICLIGGLCTLVESLIRFLEYRRSHFSEQFRHPEDQISEEHHEILTSVPPPPPPPPAPAAEDHPIYS
jgi:hypothetical protein